MMGSEWASRTNGQDDRVSLRAQVMEALRLRGGAQFLAGLDDEIFVRLIEKALTGERDVRVADDPVRVTIYKNADGDRIE